MSRVALNDEFSRSRNFGKHRSRVMRARSIIDITPPMMLSGTFLNIKKMKQDHLALKRIIRDNISLLVKINNIQRNTGFTVNRNHVKSIRPTNFRQIYARLNRIQSENFLLGCRLLTAKPSLTTRRTMEENDKLTAAKKFAVPNNVLRQFSNIMRPLQSTTMHELLRPKIYLELEVRNIRPLGRVCIQLFTEACPELVLEFVRVCTHNATHLFDVIRIFPMVWLETELRVDNPVLSQTQFVYDAHVIDHGCGPGVLSFSKSYLNGFPRGLLNFTISFKHLPVANGERIPFGIVTSGLRVLDCLQDYGTKNGKTKKDVIMIGCGVLP